MADYYEKTVQLGADPKQAANWIQVELQAVLTYENATIENSPITPEHIAQLIALVKDEVISGKIAKEVLRKVFKTGKSPEEIIKEEGLVQITDIEAIRKIVREVIEKNPSQAEEYRSGKDKLFGFFVGQIMRETQGKANPKIVNDILKEELNK